MSVYPRADGIYVYDFRHKRVRFSGSTGLRSERAAKTYEDAIREEAKKNARRAREQRTVPMTVTVAFDRFWVEVGQHYSGSYRRVVFDGLAWMMDTIGANALIRDIGANRLTEVIASRRKPDDSGFRVANGTVNRTVTELLRRILRRAATEWEQDVPKIDWKRLLLPEPKERVRELRDHEEEKLQAKMRQDYWPALQFKFASGFRRNEVVGLCWSHIDFTARTVTVHGKGGKVATVPLSSEMIAIVTPLRGHHPVKVFTFRSPRTSINPITKRRYIKGQRYPITVQGFKTAWRRYGGAAAGLEDFRLHDARHTAATRLLRTTGNLKLVQKLLRHEDITTTAKYAHAEHADLLAGMEAVAESRKKSRNAKSKSG